MKLAVICVRRQLPDYDIDFCELSRFPQEPVLGLLSVAYTVYGFNTYLGMEVLIRIYPQSGQRVKMSERAQGYRRQNPPAKPSIAWYPPGQAAPYWVENMASGAASSRPSQSSAR